MLPEIQFIYFCRLSKEQIDKTYGQLLSMFGWDWATDGVVMNLSGLMNIHMDVNQEAFISQFYVYMESLSHDHGIDYYPTFLKIMDVIGLNGSFLDKQLDKIFLGKPHYSHM
jgi:hypothetical protein